MSFIAADKKNIVEELKNRVEDDLAKAKEAFSTARDHATGDGMKAEGKHDTRSIEAGYFAGVQQKRVTELESETKLLEEINLSHPANDISVGSLVEIEFNSQKRLYFISSTSGGTILKIKDQAILVISAFSPIGTEAIGLKANDTFEVESKGQTREYRVSQIW